MNAGRVGEALTRKLGPLPAWAWFGGLAGGAYLYQRRGGKSATVLSATSPDLGDGNAGMLPGQTLDPGQSYYDPNTGKLVTAPNGGGDVRLDDPPNPPPEPSPEPGPSQKPPPAGKRKAKLKLPGVKRPAKPKGHPAKRGHPGLHLPAQRGKATKPAPKAVKPRGHAAPNKAAAPTRGRAPMPRPPALRQRPAAALVIHHSQQKVGPNPAKPGAAPVAAHPAHAVPAVVKKPPPKLKKGKK